MKNVNRDEYLSKVFIVSLQIKNEYYEHYEHFLNVYYNYINDIILLFISAPLYDGHKGTLLKSSYCSLCSYFSIFFSINHIMNVFQKCSNLLHVGGEK